MSLACQNGQYFGNGTGDEGDGNGSGSGDDGDGSGDDDGDCSGGDDGDCSGDDDWETINKLMARKTWLSDCVLTDQEWNSKNIFDYLWIYFLLID